MLLQGTGARLNYVGEAPLSKLKVLMVASVAALGALGVGAGTASAATTIACPAFTGNTTSLSPPVQFVGGGGSFGFSGSAVCTDGSGVDTNARISASGSYTNTLCGTGTATGNATITVNGTGYNVGFTIQFAAGAGVLRATTATGGGVVSIRPALDNQAAPPGNCVTHFDVAGSFAGTI